MVVVVAVLYVCDGNFVSWFNSVDVGIVLGRRVWKLFMCDRGVALCAVTALVARGSRGGR